jgi:hypothetical protein
MRRILIGVLAGLALSATMIYAQSTPGQRQLVEDLRLDASKEDFPALGGKSPFTVGPHGQIAIPINSDQQVRLYDSAGKRIGVLGRAGGGPGEFRGLSFHGWIGDTVWALDGSLQRMTYISPTAKLLRSEVMMPNLNEYSGPAKDRTPGGVYLFAPHAVIAGGTLVGFAMLYNGQTSDGTMDVKSVILSTKAQGRNRKTIAMVPPTDATSINYRPGDGTSWTRPVPFTFPPATEYASDGSHFAFLTVESSGTMGFYTVTVIRTTGDTVFSRRYPFAGKPIPRSAVDSALDAIGAPLGPGRRGSAPASSKMRELARARIPPVYAPVSGLVVGQDNTTWVQLGKTAGGTPVVALDAKGNAIASIVVPPRSRLVQASLVHVWVLETDDDGLSSIVRYRLK